MEHAPRQEALRETDGAGDRGAGELHEALSRLCHGVTLGAAQLTSGQQEANCSRDDDTSEHLSWKLVSCDPVIGLPFLPLNQKVPASCTRLLGSALTRFKGSVKYQGSVTGPRSSLQHLNTKSIA